MMASALPVIDPLGSDVSRLVEEYITKMKAIIDKVAPLVTKSYLVTSAFHGSMHRTLRNTDMSVVLR